jgi:hypothetical protein
LKNQKKNELGFKLVSKIKVENFWLTAVLALAGGLMNGLMDG